MKADTPVRSLSPGDLGSGHIHHPLAPNDEDRKNRIFIFKVVLYGTLALTGLLVLLLTVSYTLLGNEYVGTRLLAGGGLFVYLCIVSLLIQRYNAYRFSPPMFVAFYALLAAVCAWDWGVNSVFAILMFSLAITLAGIIIRAKYALIMAVIASLTLIGVQLAVEHGHQLVGSAADKWPSHFGEVIGYSVIYMIIALVSWLYSNQMERSLHKAERAELILQGQKANLEKIVQKRTAALEEKRLEEMEQMYRFTQVSSLSTGLMHDLANYLSVLTLDIEALQAQQRDHETLKRAKQVLGYIDDMVDGVRSQLQGHGSEATFDVKASLETVTHILQYKGARAGVTIASHLESRKGSLRIFGDAHRFNQIMSIFIANAIEAYPPDASDAVVRVTASQHDKQVVVSIQDEGGGISPHQRKRLFEPFSTTKKEGTGIGLFLARQIIETHFHGTVELDPSVSTTTFTITIPAA